jgi:SAM-dependent methyltransferase
MGKLQCILFRSFYHSIGRLSEGIRLTLDEGFTSGRVIDYIYANKPHGRLFIGRLLDKMYLGLKGWEAVRIRGRHLEQLIKKAMERLKKPVHIVDIACGYAAYIFRVLAAAEGVDIQATCLDINPRWIEEGKTRAAELGLKKVQFRMCNTLDEKSFLKLSGRADIAVSSGFYDWITDENLIQHSIRLVAKKVKKGGYFVLTHQLNNPYLELVSYTFKDYKGDPLRMRVYPASVVNDWLKSAGFGIEEQIIDQWDFYRVTLAKRN